MASINESALQSLKGSLKNSTIYTPDSDGYQDAIRRWSDTGIKQAVTITPHLLNSNNAY